MQPGDVVAGRFVLEALAATGGMGAVYRAVDRVTGRTVALKTMHAEATGSSRHESERAARFLREARVLAELSHPAIVEYVAHGDGEGVAPFLAMEWLEGEDLGQRLARRGPLAIDGALDLARRVAGALAVAHERGIVHRDVKPSNLFLVEGKIERVKVVDFGVVRMPDSTRVGVALGTPGYMAPEQARGERRVDARADVFALGCVLFECVAGRPAFVGEHVLALLAKILLEEAPRLSEVAPGIDPRLDELCARMMSKEPESRPESGAALAAELGVLRESVPSAPTAVHSSTMPPSLGASEQRLLAVILASGAGPPRAPDGDQATTMESSPDAVAEAVRAAAADHGARLEPLADGSIAVILEGRGVATDRAALAARCVLALRPHLPDAALGLAMGRGQMAGRLPVGPAIDRAARLVRSARVDAVRIDAVTAGLLDERFDVGADEAGLLLRGEREPSDAPRTLLGKATPFVGRERDMETLLSIVEDCVVERTPRVVLVTAPPGIGKSRLRRELVAEARRRFDPEIWLAAGDPMRAGAPFGLVAEAVRRAARVQAGEPVELRRQKLAARVGRHVEAELERVVEFVGELAGVPFSDKDSVQLRAARRDPVLMADQMRRAWEDLIGAECGARPMLLVLEDLQWGDVSSVQLVEASLRHLDEHPLMVLAFARPEVHDVFPRLWADRQMLEIGLCELRRAPAERLARAVLGETASAATITEIAVRAGGNALYLEELLRAVSEGAGGELPETVLAMVQSRLEGLDADARRLLRAASVFGRSSWIGGVGALLGERDRTGLAMVVASLQERDLLVRRSASRFPGEEEHAFRQDLARDAAYAMLTDADRALGHRLAAGWLEAAGETDAAVLAEHADRGGEAARAVRYYLTAARQALGGDDLGGAIARAERGIACGAQGEEEGLLRLAQAEAHLWRGEHERAGELAALALERLPAGSAAWCDAAANLARAAAKFGRHAVLLDVARRLLAEAARCGADPAHAMATARTASQLLQAGAHEEVEALLAHLAALGDAPFALEPAVLGAIHRAFALAALRTGDAERYLDLMEQAVQRCEEAGQLRDAALVRGAAGYANIEIGDFARAEHLLRFTLAAAQRMGLSHVVAGAKHNLGLAVLRRGEIEAGAALERDAIEAALAQSDRRLEGGSRIYLAEALAAGGDLDRAQHEAESAATVLAPWAPMRAHALATAARVRLEKGEVAGALGLAREAYALLDAGRKLDASESSVRLAYAEALYAAGDRDEARIRIDEAAERLRARVARFASAARRESFLEAVPENARILLLQRAWADASHIVP